MAGQVALNANVKEAQEEVNDSPEIETDLIIYDLRFWIYDCPA